MKTVVVGITGASGCIYAQRLIEELSQREFNIHVIATKTGAKVFAYEIGKELGEFIFELNNSRVVLEDVEDFFGITASGSYPIYGMVIAPCSMGTMARIAHGISSNLLERTAEVCMKEKRELIIVPRETPLSSISLENMLKLSQLGAWIVPATPGFYGRPKSLEDVVDFVVGKMLDALKIEHKLYERWRS